MSPLRKTVQSLVKLRNLISPIPIVENDKNIKQITHIKGIAMQAFTQVACHR